MRADTLPEGLTLPEGRQVVNEVTAALMAHVVGAGSRAFLEEAVFAQRRGVSPKMEGWFRREEDIRNHA